MKQDFALGGYLPRTLPNFNSPNPFPKGNDEYWMFEALLEAMSAVGISLPNPTVGCVFVKNGQKVASGATQAYGGLHGERIAIGNAAHQDDLKGATCYVLLEPCAHFGKQPPCMTALVESGISRCVIATKDPFKEVKGRGIQHLKDNGIKVDVGALSKEAQAWFLTFFAEQILERPIIAGKWAQTLDGHLADDTGVSKWITGASARQYTHWLRQKYQTIMVGAGTAIDDSPRLDARDCGEPHKAQPTKIVFDPRSRIEKIDQKLRERLASRTFAGSQGTLYCTTNRDLDSTWLGRVKNLHPVFLEDPDNLKSCLEAIQGKYLETHGKRLQGIFIEGGSTLLNLFMEKGLIDILHTFINPSIVGGGNHRLGAGPFKPRALKDRPKFHPIQSVLLGQDILVESVSEQIFNNVW